MVSAFQSYSASSAPPVHPSIHPSMHRPLSKKIRTFLEKMTYFYGQSIRKKAAILPTKPHTRLHLNEPCSHTSSTATLRRNPMYATLSHPHPRQSQHQAVLDQPVPSGQ